MFTSKSIDAEIILALNRTCFILRGRERVHAGARGRAGKEANEGDRCITRPDRPQAASSTMVPNIRAW